MEKIVFASSFLFRKYIYREISSMVDAFETPVRFEYNTESTNSVDVVGPGYTSSVHWSTKVPWRVCQQEWRLYRVVQ